MMLIDVKTHVIFSEDSFRAKYLDKSFPATLTHEAVKPFGYDIVHDTSNPTGSSTYKIDFVDGKWQRIWEPLPQEPLLDSVKRKVLQLVQLHLDKFAQSLGYDGIVSACTYATSTIEKFRIEGQRCVQLRDQTWMKCYDLLEQVESKKIPIPSNINDALVKALPKLEL